MGGTRFTAGGMTQETFGQALLRNITGQTQEIGAWRQGLEDLRAAGASETLIESLGLDTSPAALSAVRGLLDNTSSLTALNKALTARTAMGADVVGYEVAGGYGAVSRDLTSLRSDMSSQILAAENRRANEFASLKQQMQTFMRESGIQDGTRISLQVGNGQWVDAIVRRNIDQHERDLDQQVTAIMGT